MMANRLVLVFLAVILTIVYCQDDITTEGDFENYDDKEELKDSMNDFFDGAQRVLKASLKVVASEFKSNKSTGLDSHKIDDQVVFNYSNDSRENWLATGRGMKTVTEILVTNIIIRSFEISSLNISQSCEKTVMRTINDAKEMKDYVFRMFDASAKPTLAGSLDGTITDFGAFDECTSMVHPDLLYHGQYCMLNYGLLLPPRPPHLNLQTLLFNFTSTPLESTLLADVAQFLHVFYERKGRLGICVPSTCDINDISTIIKYISHKLIATEIPNLNVAHCTTNEKKFESHQIIILSIAAFLVLIVLCSTIFEMYYVLNLRLDELSGKISFKLDCLLSFSLYRNTIELMETRKVSCKTLGAINGIRVLSMAWIIYTHTYLIPIKETFAFARNYISTVESLFFQFILNGWVLVDTFFLVSGMLVIYQNYTVALSTGRFNLLKILINRLCRFWPAILLTVGVMMVLPNVGDGPLWNEYFDYQYDKCKKYWWATVFFFNNWMPEDKMCMLHTWYLSADFQLYLIGLAFIVPFYKNRRYAFIALFSIIFICSVYIFIITFINDLPPTVIYNTPKEVITDSVSLSVYTPTYIHLGPYCIGIFYGYLLTKYREVTLDRKIVGTLWFLSIFAVFVVLFSTYPWSIGYLWTRTVSGFYAALHRLIWSLAVGWMTYACVTGNGGLINSFLSWSFFVPLARLSFMIYLMHFLVLWWRYAYLRERLPFGHYTLFCEFLINVILSTGFAAVSHLVVEVPFGKIQKLILSDRFNWAQINLIKRKTDHNQSKSLNYRF